MRTLSDPHPPGRWFFIPLVRPWCFCSWFGPRSHFLTLYSVWLARRLLLLLLLLMMMLLYYLLIPRLPFPKTFLVFTPFSSTIYPVRAACQHLTAFLSVLPRLACGRGAISVGIRLNIIIILIRLARSDIPFHITNNEWLGAALEMKNGAKPPPPPAVINR